MTSPCCPICKVSVSLPPDLTTSAGPAAEVDAAAKKAETAPFPFCSSNCKMADLSRWFDGDYVISQPIINDPEALQALAETDPETLQKLVDAESARALALLDTQLTPNLGNGESK